MPQPPDDTKNQPGPDWSELPLQKRKRETSPAELLDRTFDGGKHQRHKQSLKGRKWKRFREKVPSECGTGDEDQGNADHQKGIPGRAAAPLQCPFEKEPQPCGAAVDGNKGERCDCRCVHGQEEERMVAGELAEDRGHRFREKNVQSKDTPRQAE